MSDEDPEYDCPSCGHPRLQFVAVEENGDPSYICTSCGDEWFESTLMSADGCPND